MNNTVKLQIPITKTLKEQGFKKAQEFGYSSLQEVIRVFITNFVNDRIVPSFSQSEPLPEEIEARFAKILDEHLKDPKRKKYSHPSDAMKYLSNDE